MSSGHREVVVEHMLVGMLEEEDGDCDLIMRYLEKNRVRLIEQLETVLQSFRTDNQGKPVFSESLFVWLEDAWLSASLERSAGSLRTGELFLQFLKSPGRYTAETFSEIESIPLDGLTKNFQDVVANSPEAQETIQASQGGVSKQRGDESTGAALEKYTTSFTERAAAGEIDPIFGRHREIRQLADILTRRRKNNPIIVGEPGVGKSALVEGLAHAIVNEEVPQELRGVDLRNLDLGLLQAGAGVRGEFENRLKGVINDVKASLKPVILFIDEAHTIIGAGGPQGGGDAANLLKPELARGQLKTIAATTWSEYKKYFEKDAALERRFQPIKVDEPSVEDAATMLRGLRTTYESAHQVVIRDDAIAAASELSHRYLAGRQLPDKAVDVLDTAAARVRMEMDTKPERLVEQEQLLKTLQREHEALQRDLQELHHGENPELQGKLDDLQQRIDAANTAATGLTEQWQKEIDAVNTLREARAALAEAGEDADTEGLRHAVDEAARALEAAQNEEHLVHGEVDADAVAQVIGSWTGIPVGKMKAETVKSILGLDDALRDRVRGQEPAVATISDTIRMAHAGVRDPSTPIGVLLFVGPSGVGKTEAALTLADVLYGGDRFLTAINMSEFQERHSVSRLVGSPPGYVGYGEGGVLTEAVRQRPYSVVLLDECEKADLEVMNLFYQVFDKGVLNDGEGRSIDFKNAVVIMTSNLASDVIAEAYSGEEEPSVEEVIEKVRPVLSQHFKPALLARMTVVPFRPISTPIMRQICGIKLGKMADRLRENHGIETTFADGVVDVLAKRCTDQESGARNVEHLLRSSLLPVISRELLDAMAQGQEPKGLEVDVSPTEDWRIDLV